MAYVKGATSYLAGSAPRYSGLANKCTGGLRPNHARTNRLNRVREVQAHGDIAPALNLAAQPQPRPGEDEASFFIKNLRSLPWQRAAVWAVVSVVALQLSDFFGIFMGTFILSFVGRSMSVWLEGNFYISKIIRNDDARRRVLVISYMLLIFGVIATFGGMTIPYIVREGADFIHRLQSENIWVVVLEKMRMGVGEAPMEALERFLLLVSHEDVMQAPEVAIEAGTMAWTSERFTKLGSAIYTIIQGYTDKAITVTSQILTWVTHFTLQVCVSLILTGMLLWDWPKITQGVNSLARSRIGGLYEEVAPSLKVFAQLFGKALQAQTKVAVVNTLLTGLGMWLLGIPGMLLLSLFVFLCSFIPVMGCILSTFPIGFVALTEYGFIKLFCVIGMVTVVHLVEAYGLNPFIYSAHLRLHPLLVLAVLVVAEHSLGVWGLLLAVPMTVFAVDYCLTYPKDSLHGVVSRELLYVERHGDSTDEVSDATAQPLRPGVIADSVDGEMTDPLAT